MRFDAVGVSVAKVYQRRVNIIAQQHDYVLEPRACCIERDGKMCNEPWTVFGKRFQLNTCRKKGKGLVGIQPPIG